jgi:ankyrin repeat protein
MSDSSEDMRSVMRAERIAEKSFSRGQQWPFEGGISSSDEDWLENAGDQERSIVKTEWNRLRREWVSKQPPGYHIDKLVNKDGPKARAEIKKIFAANPDLDVNKLFLYYSWGENKGKPDKRHLLVESTSTLPMFKLFVELGLDLNNKKQMLKILEGILENKEAAKFIIKNVELNLNLIPQGAARQYPIIMQYLRIDKKILDLLIEKGANINAVNKDGLTTLMIIYNQDYWCRESKAKLYLEKGADPNIQDNEGNTLLHHFKDALLKKLEDINKRGFSYGRYVVPKSIEEMFFGENIDPVFQRRRDDLYNLFKHGANPFIKNKKGECVMTYPSFAKIYSRYMSDLLNSKQKLALAVMLLPDTSSKKKDIDELPEEVILKIGEFLNVNKQVVDDIRATPLYQKYIREELESAIKESYPGFDTDHLIEHYQKELENPGLPENTRQQYVKMIERRIQKLGNEEMKSRFQSRTKRNSRASRSASTQNKSDRQSRSLRSSEELDIALKMSVQEAKSGSKKKKIKRTKKNKKIK